MAAGHVSENALLVYDDLAIDFGKIILLRVQTRLRALLELAKSKSVTALARASRVAGENSTTEPPVLSDNLCANCA